VQNLHNLLLQSTTNDTIQLKAVRMTSPSPQDLIAQLCASFRPPLSSIKSSTKTQHAYRPSQASSQTHKRSRFVYYLAAFRLCSPIAPICRQVRQLAAIEMRKRVSTNSGNLWLQVSQPDREQLKTQLPQIVLRESKFVSSPSLSPIISLTSS
jgi:hypothetical protein